MTSSSPDLERRAAVALSLLEGVGPATHRDLVERTGSAAAALRLKAGRGSHAALDRAEALLAECAGGEIAVLVRGEPEYPAQLLELPQPPAVLYARGRRELLGAPSVAVVGTRDASSYGERVATQLAEALAAAGVCVVSGLARGVDAAAHLAALAAGGATTAVLGTGVDVAYPAAHRALLARVSERGLVLSEEPPGTRALPGAFPKRNRIIAALCRATIVVEAGVRSGALITAAHALELGRSVAAVPGPIDSPRSQGTNELLRDGAIVIAGVADALALVGATVPRQLRPPVDDPLALALWDALAQGAADLDTLSARAGLPARECMAAIATLEIAGAVSCAHDGEIRRR